MVRLVPFFYELQITVAQRAVIHSWQAVLGDGISDAGELSQLIFAGEVHDFLR